MWYFNFMLDVNNHYVNSLDIRWSISNCFLIWSHLNGRYLYRIYYQCYLHTKICRYMHCTGTAFICQVAYVWYTCTVACPELCVHCTDVYSTTVPVWPVTSHQCNSSPVPSLPGVCLPATTFLVKIRQNFSSFYNLKFQYNYLSDR